MTSSFWIIVFVNKCLQSRQVLHVPTAWSGAPVFARHISTNIDTWQVLPSSVDITGSYLRRPLSNIACTKHGPCVNEYVYDVMGACSRYP